MGERKNAMYQEVLRRIQHVKKTGATELDLNVRLSTEVDVKDSDPVFDDLTEIPRELGGLITLKRLDLGGPWIISDLSPLTVLRSLQSLKIFGPLHKITDLSPLCQV
jgi:hypothetical protein